MSYSWISIEKAIRKYHVTSEEISELERTGKICRGPNIEDKEYGKKYQYSEWQIAERFSLRDKSPSRKETINTIVATALITKTIDELSNAFSNDKNIVEKITSKYPVLLHVPIEIILPIQRYQALRSIKEFEMAAHFLIETAVYLNNHDEISNYFPVSASKKYKPYKINLRTSEMVPIRIFSQKYNLSTEEASLCFLNFGIKYIFEKINENKAKF